MIQNPSKGVERTLLMTKFCFDRKEVAQILRKSFEFSIISMLNKGQIS